MSDGPRTGEAIDLGAIRARREKAMPGPWYAEVWATPAEIDLPVGADGSGYGRVLRSSPGTDQRLLVTDLVFSANNAEFIAHARQDVEDLLAYVEHLQGLLGVNESQDHGRHDDRE